MTTDNFCFYLQNRLVKQEVNGTVILPLLVFPDLSIAPMGSTNSKFDQLWLCLMIVVPQQQKVDTKVMIDFVI
jgi:hypothetical protein